MFGEEDDDDQDDEDEDKDEDEDEDKDNNDLNWKSGLEWILMQGRVGWGLRGWLMHGLGFEWVVSGY